MSLQTADLNRSATGLSGESEIALPDFAPKPKRTTPARVVRTIRHLGVSQLAWLARERLRRHTRPARRPPAAPASLRRRVPAAEFPEWQPETARRMIATREFELLNLANEGRKEIPWSAKNFPKLWLYHLNYCDFLNVDLSSAADQWLLLQALAIMEDWCRRNHTGKEPGWEPYPLSLRIVNWLKFLLRNGARLEELGEGERVARLLASLRDQTAALERQLEFHLRGNHLLKNIKALMFAGDLLETAESERWWKRGARLLATEVESQILRDGGHFERSPMYHAQVFEDLLDLATLATAGRRVLGFAPRLGGVLVGMADFLAALRHPDGAIALFNDSALGIARPAAELLARAKQVLNVAPKEAPEVTVFEETGYAVVRTPNSQSCLIFDCGRVGPDEQPGHAHCDVLSYALSLDGQRIVVDTGVSTYAPGPVRHYERSTAAHNTLRIDGEEQAEIWASFRVGRRPAVSPIEKEKIGECQILQGAHYGYARLGVTHARQILLGPGQCWVVIDTVEGSGRHRIESFIHFHPAVYLEPWPSTTESSSDWFQRQFLVHAGNRSYFLLVCGGLAWSLEQAWYSPEFGLRQAQLVAYGTGEGTLPGRFAYALVPAEGRTPDIFFDADQNCIRLGSHCVPLD